jgi:hypothetical protein
MKIYQVTHQWLEQHHYVDGGYVKENNNNIL